MFIETVISKAGRDYNEYTMNIRQKLIYTSAAVAVIFLLSYMFYRSLVLSVLLTPLALFYPRMKKVELIKLQKKELNIQFKDMLYSLSSSLSAGKSIEMAFREVIRDIAVLYQDNDAYIVREVEHIVRRLEMNGTIESALADFADRSHVEDIRSFSDVFSICKRSGGNMVEVIKNTTGIINDKIEIYQEIETLLSQRKFEQKMLNILPAAMLLLLSLSSPAYMEPVFTTFAGRIAMSGAVLLFAAAWFISKKLVEIKL